MSYKLINNKSRSRFEVHVDNDLAFVSYTLFKGGISFDHTIVPKNLTSKGIGSFLAKNVLEYAKNEGLRVKPYCPFIKTFIDKHPEYQSISDFH